MFEDYYPDKVFGFLWTCETHYQLHESQDDLITTRYELEEQCGCSLTRLDALLRKLSPGKSFHRGIVASTAYPIYTQPLGLYQDMDGQYVVSYQVGSWNKNGENKRPYKSDECLAGLRCLILQEKGIQISSYDLYVWDRERQYDENSGFVCVAEYGSTELEPWLKQAEAELPDLLEILSKERTPRPNQSLCPYCFWKDQCPNYWAPMSMLELAQEDIYSVILELD